MTANSVSRESLSVAAGAAALVVDGARNADLAGPTPCAEYDLRALINHFTGTTAALTSVGRGEPLDAEDPYGAKLDHTAGDWAGGLSANLSELVAVWGESSTWEGTVEMGGGEMPAVMIGEMVLAEVVLHAWDLATATGQMLVIPEEVAAELRRGIEETAEMGRQMGAYGDEVRVPDGASELDRALAASGRQPVL